MSIDSTRKETKGWEINSSGKMVNLTAGDGIVIDEAAPVVESAGMPITDSAVIKTEPPPMPNDPGRGRRSTLDFFNDEMAVLDRPLEGAVEFVDEAQRLTRWRRAGMFALVVAVIGGGGSVVLSRRHPAVESRAQASQPATSPGAAAPAVIAAAATTPAPAAEVPAPEAPAPAAAADDGSATEEAAAAAAPSHTAADKVKAKSGHGKHSRSTSSKRSHHHSSKRTVSSKRSSRH